MDNKAAIEGYPGDNYQRLFNAMAGTSIPLQSEMDDIIQIVHEDFPASSSPVQGRSAQGIRQRIISFPQLLKNTTNKPQSLNK